MSTLCRERDIHGEEMGVVCQRGEVVEVVEVVASTTVVNNIAVKGKTAAAPAVEIETASLTKLIPTYYTLSSTS